MNTAMWEVQPCEFGQGVFALADISPLTYVGTYIGKLISREQYKLKRQALSRYTDYCAEVPNNPNFVYDPTDERGDLDKEYIHNIPLYINEPPPGHLNNCCWVFHKHNDFGLTTTLEIWTFREIKKGEQLHIFYGNDYARDYEINRDLNACGLPNHFNFTISSQPTNSSKFVIDEYPEWLCDIINSCDSGSNNVMDIWKAGQSAQRLKSNPLLLVDKCKDATLVPFLQTLHFKIQTKT